jgi:hypothetical protein
MSELPNSDDRFRDFFSVDVHFLGHLPSSFTYSTVVLTVLAPAFLPILQKLDIDRRNRYDSGINYQPTTDNNTNQQPQNTVVALDEQNSNSSEKNPSPTSTKHNHHPRQRKMVTTRPRAECSSPPREQIVNCPGAPRKKIRPSSYYHTPRRDDSHTWTPPPLLPTRLFHDVTSSPVHVTVDSLTSHSRFRKL